MSASRVERALHLLRSDDARGSQELIELADERARQIARRYLSAFPTVAAWYETGDVRQLALLRIDRALTAVEINDAAHFYRLIARKIRQTLLDLKRRLHGAQGPAAHERRRGDFLDARPPLPEPEDESLDPRRLSEWLDIHQAIESLPERHRVMFDLLWYGELSQEEAAVALGLSARQIRRRWNEARLSLYKAIPEAFDA